MYSSSVECDLPKVDRWVRLPLPAPKKNANFDVKVSVLFCLQSLFIYWLLACACYNVNEKSSVYYGRWKEFSQVNMLHHVTHQDCRFWQVRWLGNPVKVRGIARCCKCRSLYSWSNPVIGETWEGGIQTWKRCLLNAWARRPVMIEFEGRRCVRQRRRTKIGARIDGRFGNLPLRLFLFL